MGAEVRLIAFTAATPSIRALFRQADRPEGSWNWFDTLARATLTETESAVLAVLTDSTGNARAILPLIRGGRHDLRGLAAPYTSRFCPLLPSEEDAETLGLGLCRLVPGHLYLDALDATDPMVAALLRGMRRGGLIVVHFRHFANWFEATPDIVAFWASRAGNLRELVRRKTRRLDTRGRLSFRCLMEPADLSDAAALYESIYEKSWKAAEPHPLFIRNMICALAADGTVRMGFAQIDDIPAAVQLWLVQNGRATIFKLAHDPRFDTFSPGTLLTHHMMMERGRVDQLVEIDFGRGDDAYKREWLREKRWRIGVIACNPRTTHGMGAILKLVLPTVLGSALRGLGLRGLFRQEMET